MSIRNIVGGSIDSRDCFGLNLNTVSFLGSKKIFYENQAYFHTVCVVERYSNI